MAEQPTAATFIKDVAQHAMTVIRDDGLSRHLRFAKPGTSCMYFDLITWSGHLCYTGDMGTFVFSRIDDMFRFFRPSADDVERRGPLPINRPYWAEKLLAADRNGGWQEFCRDTFREAVEQYMDDAEASAEVREAVEDQVLSRADDGEHFACQAVYDFDEHGFRFHDFFEHRLWDYTYRFTWCCMAIVWGIQQYDSSKAKAAA